MRTDATTFNMYQMPVISEDQHPVVTIFQLRASYNWAAQEISDSLDVSIISKIPFLEP